MLTEKQQKALDIITDFMGRYWKSPTIDELQKLLSQKSKRWAVQYLEALEKKGFITRGWGFRSIKLWNTIGSQTMLTIPILGIANAGKPLSIAEQFEYGSLPISKKAAKWEKDDYFFVKIDGTSMNDFKVNWKTIESWSYALISKKDNTINSKDAFLFIVDNAATVKVPKIEWDNIYLMPKSKDTYHKPIILSNDDNVIINWKVVDVFNFEKIKD
jgi:SOS-response transcriptional repressor LexA